MGLGVSGQDRVQRRFSKEVKKSLSSDSEAMCQTMLRVWAWVFCGVVLVCT